MKKCLSVLVTSFLMILGLNAQDYNTTGAVSTATGDDLYKTQTANFTNTFAGRFSGLTVMEGSGMLGYDTAKWLIRGIGSYSTSEWSTAKIFVDGFEVNKEYLSGFSPAEIDKVEILKDAAAVVLYGERGANGVVNITTKRGHIGKATVNARVRTGVQSPSLLNKPLRSYDYANLYNQAVSNDNGMQWSPVYDEAALAAYKNGTGIDVDWYKEALRSAGKYVDGDVVLNGGNENARYNINLGYLDNTGIFNTSNTDQTANLGYQKFNVRANLDFNVLKFFEVKFDMGGRIEMLKRPNYGMSQLFMDLANYPSNIYDIYDDDAKEHLSGTAIYPDNPYASVNALGWVSRKARALQTNLSVKEKLDMLTPGLYLEEAFSFYSHTLSGYSKTRDYARWNGGVNTTTNQTTTITASGYGSDGMQDWKQARVAAGYDASFGKSSLTAKVSFGISAYKGDGYFSYKYNTENLNGLLHYNYDNRYVAEAGFSYFGNDAYAKGNRWAAYPAVSAAWIVSNEDFLRGGEAVNFLKVRASAGMSGSSDSNATSVLSDYSSNGRYLFKEYYTYSYIGSVYFGQTSGTWQSTAVPMFKTNKDAHAEKSAKFNIGVDAILFNRLNVTADAYYDKRTDILTLDNSLMGYYGKQYYFSNIGKMDSKGVELAISYSGKSGDLSYEINASGAWNTNKIGYMAEVAPANGFSTKTGRALGTYIGLVADGFYDITDFDADGKLNASLAQPAFGGVQPGDIKYLDLDRNGIIDQNDATKIGRSYFPEWTFAFGGRLGCKGFDLEVLFQGVAGVSANLLDNSRQTVAFVNHNNAYEIAKGAWAYYPMEGIDTRATATYPRLTTRSNPNNYQASSFWIKDASFLKLRNVEFGYNFQSSKLRETGIENLRVFVSGHNLLTISPLQRSYNLDPENLTGLYPVMRTINAGASITF